MRVERRVVDRPVTAADADAFEETVIDVPLRRETVDVQKQARVAEEVVVGKEAVQRTERVADTVRKEEVFVDEDATLIDDREAGLGPLLRSGPVHRIRLNRVGVLWLLPSCSARALLCPETSATKSSHTDCTAHCP